ncbi:MAG TPA: DegT/DnrJ/EryC1/StrS family aminotransferase [Candidatus Binatia bacterium]
MSPYPSRVPLAVPCWNGQTYRAALRAIFRGRTVAGPEVEQLKSLILSRIDVADALLCGSGSLALEIVLASCGIGPGNEVVIPSFCCTAIVPPIVNLGAVPVFTDVGEELNTTAAAVDDALTLKTKAVIVPHLFGNPAEIEAIEKIARAKNISVIDDAAQALGATIDGRAAGSFGDAGVVSFGAEKICFGVGGGAAVSRREGFFAGTELPRPRRASATRNFSSTLFRRRWRRWTFPLDSLLPDKAEPDEPPLSYRREEMANVSAAVALTLARTLDANIAARRERVRMYRALLGSAERLQLIAHRPGSACLTQVVRVLPRRPREDAAARAIDALRADGYEVQGSYMPIHLLPAYERWRRRSLPNTEEVWPDLIELPCEPEVSLRDAELIAGLVLRTIK